MNNEKGYCVYKHTTPNGKVYIGQTCKKPNERWSNGYGYKNQMFYKAIEKYGWDNIIHEVVCSNLTKDEADQKEIELISYFDSTNPNKHSPNTLLEIATPVCGLARNDMVVGTQVRRFHQLAKL